MYKTRPYLQCELYHWIDVLDRFDAILERVAKPESIQPNEMMIYLCRKLEEKQVISTLFSPFFTHFRCMKLI